MNFLSHYYFDRDNLNNYEVLGAILPDLLKNANKSWNIYPEKHKDLFQTPIQKQLLKGWKKHLLIDKLFHNTAFFFHHQHQIKLVLKEAIKDSPVKPFFLGHIALELILDHLLIVENKIDVDKLYQSISKTSAKEIEYFFKLNGLDNTDKFFVFFDSFIKNQYLHSYREAENIAYALKRICMRVWNNPFTSYQEEEITKIISSYIFNLREDFILIFDEIESHWIDE